MAVVGRKDSAVSASAHTMQSNSSFLSQGMLKRLSLVIFFGLLAWAYKAFFFFTAVAYFLKEDLFFLVATEWMLKRLSLVIFFGLLAWAYKAIQPPPPKICGSPGGPPVTASRIKLNDGRHLAYKEFGVQKELAKYKIIFIHGLKACRHDVLPVSPALLEELGVYLVTFDRAGYGESDPNPKRTEKSTALDIEQLADQLELGSKFYIIGNSLGGQIAWTCLKYIPKRLAGAAILAPVPNFWWRGFPSNVSKVAFNQQSLSDRFTVGVAHYAPWLTYWWNTQTLFSASSAVVGNRDIFPPADLEILAKFAPRATHKEEAKQQGLYESIHRDIMVSFKSWEFSPLELKDPFQGGEGTVHLWHGSNDWIVPDIFSRHIGQKLPWVCYHEVPNAGHLFPYADGMSDAIFKSLLLGDG